MAGMWLGEQEQVAEDSILGNRTRILAALRKINTADSMYNTPRSHREERGGEAEMGGWGGGGGRLTQSANNTPRQWQPPLSRTAAANHTLNANSLTRSPPRNMHSIEGNQLDVWKHSSNPPQYPAPRAIAEQREQQNAKYPFLSPRDNFNLASPRVHFEQELIAQRLLHQRQQHQHQHQHQQASANLAVPLPLSFCNTFAV
eukprot:3031359-Rhodomonas_salina.1